MRIIIFDKYQGNNIIQFDINKIPVYELNQLNKYINDCKSCIYDFVSFVSDDDYYNGDLD